MVKVTAQVQYVPNHSLRCNWNTHVRTRDKAIESRKPQFIEITCIVKLKLKPQN